MIPQKHKYLLNNLEIKTLGIKENNFTSHNFNHTQPQRKPPPALLAGPRILTRLQPQNSPAVTHPSKLLLFKTTTLTNTSLPTPNQQTKRQRPCGFKSHQKEKAGNRLLTHCDYSTRTRIPAKRASGATHIKNKKERRKKNRKKQTKKRVTTKRNVRGKI